MQNHLDILILAHMAYKLQTNSYGNDLSNICRREILQMQLCQFLSNKRNETKLFKRIVVICERYLHKLIIRLSFSETALFNNTRTQNLRTVLSSQIKKFDFFYFTKKTFLINYFQKQYSKDLVKLRFCEKQECLKSA